MTSWMPWKIAGKDFKVIRRKKSLLYTLIAFPLVVSLGLPAVVLWVVQSGSATYSQLIPLIYSLSFFFVIVTAVITTALASYSIVGEKVEKSLEPLLATPTTDGEILLGKSLAAFVPVILCIWLGEVVFMTFIDIISRQQLGYLLYPNWTMAVLLLLVTPLSCLFSIELDIIFSSRVTDLRAAQQLGILTVLPLAGVYVMGELGAIRLDLASTLLVVGTALLLVDVVLFYIARAAFGREEILTKWK